MPSPTTEQAVGSDSASAAEHDLEVALTQAEIAPTEPTSAASVVGDDSPSGAEHNLEAALADADAPGQTESAIVEAVSGDSAPDVEGGLEAALTETATPVLAESGDGGAVGADSPSGAEQNLQAALSEPAVELKQLQAQVESLTESASVLTQQLAESQETISSLHEQLEGVARELEAERTTAGDLRAELELEQEVSSQQREQLKAADHMRVHAETLLHSVAAEQGRSQELEAELLRANAALAAADEELVRSAAVVQAMEVQLLEERSRAAELEELMANTDQSTDELTFQLEESVGRSQALEANAAAAIAAASELQLQLEVAALAAASALEQLEAERGRCQELQVQVDELELLREDLEETIVARRRELKVLRQFEVEAKASVDEARLESGEAGTRLTMVLREFESAQAVHAQEVAALQDQVRALQGQLAAGASSQELDQVRAVAAAEVAALQNEVRSLQEQLATRPTGDEALRDAERRHLDAERRLVAVKQELDEARSGGASERLERRCLLLETDLKAANQELMALERLQQRWETERTVLNDQITALRNNRPSAAGGDEGGEIGQWKSRCDDLRETLRKQRADNDRLQERIEVLMKAKDLEEKQRKEVESRLRTALRIQARQQG